jgi:hypothetical protein
MTKTPQEKFYCRLHELYEYKDGELYWKVNHRRHRIGDIAGYMSSKNREMCSIDGIKYYKNRVIYIMAHGEILPHQQIRFIDGNRENHRIENLRIVG